ncbi:MAG: NAD-dependent succinate-semialdehyde dehydrogenase [Acinetobacter sp.]|jgi:succinate-semialdehyde dehydrogenase/glutarate-semialdehyde dehydrogenase|uniref:NAD-dependent succinate-semialdehyde dehydrogenase n=1 Tax=Acinetobacter TaxID=469 RepID=UPI0009955A83|nr:MULTISPECIES: NAD-dependent succinate-semialdehyde dehydrogenase [unclassified Acinetobacter]MCD0189330.1 NAD-dependent succinate-semialdehyde dehydrogenase [Acinetobacter sp. PW68]OOW08122.1 NAD-dependent succinate-semialdehyde dehydrogenase [Acinetobacter sp. MF4640]
MYQNTQLYIAGQWRDSIQQQTLAVINPATEKEIGHVAKASLDDVEQAVQAAQSGFEIWKNTPAQQRAKIMQKAAILLRERAAHIAELMSLEQGKPLKQAKMEVLSAADIIEWFSGEAIRSYGQVIPSRQRDVHSYTIKTPVGIVAAFTPWNFPINQVVRKLSAAVAAGCAIIVKGPEETPASPAQLVQAFHDAGIPAGVINLVYGEPAEISEYLIPHPAIQKISFTGSTVVGKQLAALAGKHMKKTTMELGGHAPVLIFKDANLDLAAKEMAAAKFRNAGQVCIAPTRFLIEKAVYEDFVEKLKNEVSQLKVGHGLDDNVDVGPMIHERAYQNIQKTIQNALQEGAELVCGGQTLEGPGYFIEPTIIKDVPLTAACMDQEPFGPLAICIPFESYDEAVTEANRLNYGLAAYAYTESNSTCLNLARDIASGMLTINHVGLGFPELPFGGLKDSGYGTEGGSEAIESYLDTRLVTVASRR